MPRQTAGILLYRGRGAAREILLVHAGGPYWKNKDAAAWSIPKGEFEAGEDPLAAAQREFAEETGIVLPGPFLALGTLRATSGGKVLHAWASEGDCDPAAIVSNTFKMEWPPRSGSWAEFPEVDRAAWFAEEAAAEKLHHGQVELLVRLRAALSA